MTTNGINAAQEMEQVEVIQEETGASGDGGFKMPSLQVLRGGIESLQEMDEARTEEVYVAAQNINLKDRLEAIQYGYDVQQETSKLTEEFIGNMEASEVDDVAKIVQSQNAKMAELKIGDLEPKWHERLFRKVLPGKQAAKLESYLNQHKELSSIIDEGAQALADQKDKLCELYTTTVHLAERNKQLYEQLRDVIAAAELRYAAEEKYAKEFKEQHKNSKNAATTREIVQMDQLLAMFSRKINSLKAVQQETLTSGNVMDRQADSITALIQMIDEQVTFSRTAWNNTAAIASVNKKMQGTAQAIEHNRKSVEDMLKQRGGNVISTVQAILNEQKQGVVNVAVIELATQHLLALNAAIIKGNKDIRDSMKDANNSYHRMADKVQEMNRSAAAFTEQDIADLDKQVITVETKLDEAEEAELAAKTAKSKSRNKK